MEEKEMMSEDFKNKVEAKVEEKIATNFDVTRNFTTFLARIEAMNIVVTIINAFLNERQKADNKLSDAELLAIQHAVEIENTKTENLYKAIDEAMNKNK